MKIKTKVSSYEKVMEMARPEHKKPMRPNILFRTVIRIGSIFDLLSANFTFNENYKQRAGEGPYLILMNHSSFIDLEIVSRIFFPMPYCIVCTSDGFVGKPLFMRLIGCIPTKKFVSDISLIGDIRCAIEEKKTSVLMYPEASYSFDGTATPLPRKMGVFLKRLGVPVIMVKTQGAFSRDPLYNCLQKRKVKVSADAYCLFTKEELKEKSVDQIDFILDEAFTFDNFAWQYENKIEINEPFRADGLNRILYKCAHCGAEGTMEGSGTSLTCRSCGKKYELDPLGRLHAVDGETEFSHIPDWYAWQRAVVRNSILDGTYSLETDVDIAMMVNYDAIYKVGTGHLTHNENGFTLTGCGGKLFYSQSPLASYSLYSDYFWYELGDIICIGDNDTLYYLFPAEKDIVAKTRIAAEELYKIKRRRKAPGLQR